MISVVIPLYNKEKQIRATLESVLAQNYQDFEIVIVNDGSTDRSVEEAAAVNDSRIRFIHQKNAGVSAARNRGIEEARGEFIAFLDADDRWKPEYLQTQYELTQRYPECSVFACNYEFVDALGQVKPTIIRKLPFSGAHGVLSNYFEVASCSNPPLWTSAVMVCKEAIQSIGGFPLGIGSGEDLLTWARLACKYHMAYSRKALAQFIFDRGIFNDDQQQRMPESKDWVGEQLHFLWRENAKIPGLKRYIALWHKMRARIFLEKGKRGLSIKECIRSLRWSLSMKVGIFMVLNMLPMRIGNYIIKQCS